MPFDPLQIADWVRTQVVNENIADDRRRAAVEQMCLMLARDDDPQVASAIRFAERAQLLWRGITRGNRHATALLDDANHDAEAVSQLLNHGDPNRAYHPAFAQFLRANGIVLEGRVFAVVPEEVAFRFAGGVLPDGWSVRHVYHSPVLRFNGEPTSLCADIDGDHFTQSAGIVALSPEFERDYFDLACVIKMLRLCAWQKFRYDPDHYFNPNLAHDEFGFVTHV